MQMSHRPVPALRSTLPADSIERELESAARYAASALAPATRRAYDYDWRVFAEWCVARGLQPLPASPETVAVFLAAEADRDLHPVTITKRAAAIAAALARRVSRVRARPPRSRRCWLGSGARVA